MAQASTRPKGRVYTPKIHSYCSSVGLDKALLPPHHTLLGRQGWLPLLGRVETLNLTTLSEGENAPFHLHGQ